MKNKTITILMMAMLLLVALPSCRETEKKVSSKPIPQNGRLMSIYPKPSKSPVLDQTGVFSKNDIDEITKTITELDSLKLAQIAVVTVNDFAGRTAQSYAKGLGNNWGVGHKEKNDGITIVIKPKRGAGSGEVGIATGRGIQNVLTDKVCEHITKEIMVPRFKANDYGGAVKAALSDIKGKLK